MSRYPFRFLGSLVLSVVLMASGCGDEDAGSDAGSSSVDSGRQEDGATDAGPTPTDADGAGDTGAEFPDGATVYYIVRHTERDPGPNPPINPEGEIRAQALAERLADAGIDEIVTTDFIRGQQSGAPLAERLGQEITVAPFSMDASWPAFAMAVGGWQRDREVAGTTYLMIGHSGGYNSTLMGELGATVAAGTGERYEDLVILVRAMDGTVTVTEELYGGPSSLDP